MKYSKLKNTNIEISDIGLGTWIFGGDVYGKVEESDCINAVLTAVDNGINLIDTAPIYGFGKSEEIVGKAIRGIRDEVVIATKCGLIKKGKDIISDLSPDSIRKEIEDSLRRLDIDCVDIYQCHWPDSNIPLEDTMETLHKLKEEGKIKNIGMSNFGKDLLIKANDIENVITLQSQYSMLNRELNKEVLPCARELKIGLIAYGSLAGGILSGKYKQVPAFKGFDARKFFYKYYSKNVFEKVNKLLNKLLAIGRPLNQIAINWVRQQAGVASVIVGARNPEQAIKNAEASSWDLSDDEMKAINDILNSEDL